jgi:hypothetical protein
MAENNDLKIFQIHHPVLLNTSLCVEFRLDFQVFLQRGVGILDEPKDVFYIGVVF